MILIIMARCLNILIFPRFWNNNIVTFYFIFFIYLFKLVIFLRDVTQHTQQIHTHRYLMHNHMPHTLNKANQQIKQPIITM